MTNSDGNNRLDRIEALLLQAGQRIDSNAQAIQAMLDAQTSERLRHQEWMEENQRKMEQMDEAIRRLISVQEGTNRLLASLDDDRPTILRRLNSIENKIDRLLEQDQNDR